jgi:hypothetical protein
MLAYKEEILNSLLAIAADPTNSMKQAERFNSKINEVRWAWESGRCWETLERFILNPN